jgi:hypothetical protein
MVTCHTTIANMTPTTCDQSRDHTTSTTSTTCDQSHDHPNHVISHTTTRPWRQPHVISHTTIPIMWSVTRPRNQSHDICNQSHDHPNHVISHTTTPSVTRPHDHPRPPFIYSGSFTKLFSSNGPHSPLIHFITTFFILQHITYERNSSIYSFHYYWKFPY